MVLFGTLLSLENICIQYGVIAALFRNIYENQLLDNKLTKVHFYWKQTKIVIWGN